MLNMFVPILLLCPRIKSQMANICRTNISIFFPLKLKNLEQIKLAFCYKFSKNKDYLRMINQYKLYNLINVSNQIICFFHRNLISTRKKLVHWNYWIMQYLMPVIVKWRRKMRMEGHVRRYYLCYLILYKLS